MRFYLVALCLLLVAGPLGAQNRVGDVEAGRALALRTCARCHVVAEQQSQPAIDGVRPFAAIARNPAVTEQSLRVFLQTPHPPMPDFSLTRREIDDAISYILSLKDR